MFSAYCPTHEATLLFSLSQIVQLRATPIGIELAVRCACGEELEILTGRAHLDDTRTAPLSSCG